MPRAIFPLLRLLILVILLTSCNSDQLPLTTLVDVQITQSGCHPLEWRVPAGQTVSLKLSNQALKEYTWILMSRPVTPPFDGSDASNVFFVRQILSGTSAAMQFNTPAAAGEYQVICSPLDHGAGEQAGRIIVVQQP